MLSGFFLTMSVGALAQADTPISDWNFSSYSTIDNVRYQFDKTHKLARWCSWSNYNAPETVEIPSTVTYQNETYTVVSFSGESYHYEQEATKKLVLPATLRQLGRYSLYQFKNIHEFVIPASIESLGSNVTRDNTTLRFESVTPPATVEGALSNYNQVKVYVPGEGFEDYFQTDYIEDCCVISNDVTKGTIELDKVESGTLGYRVVSARLPEITNYANVNKLIIHAGTLDENDWYQIRQMKNLVEIQIPDMAIQEIPIEAMKNCWQLERITLPNTLETICQEAFYGTGFSSIILPNTLTTIKGGNNFYNCDSLKSIIIPDGVTELPTSCFYDCDRLTAAQLPANLTTMGGDCFSRCDLATIDIPGTLKTVPGSAFYENRNMETVVFNEGIEQINSYAFRYCEALQQLTFPSTMKGIYTSAFEYCSGLTEIALNEGLETIDSHAFGYCTGLTVVTLPSSIIYCLNRPFYYCTGITQINCKSLLPPTVRNYTVTYGTDNIEVHVPLWSFQEYMTTPGWLEYQPHIVIDPDILPENIYINKEFSFLLQESQMKEGYTPNIRLDYNTERIDDGFGHEKVERGNLTISSQSKLNVNNFSMYVSPYAKYYADMSRFYNNYNYDYDCWSTEYNPNSLVVKGEMRAENQEYKLWLYCDRWQFISFPFDVKVSDIVPTTEGTQWVIRRYDGEKRAAQAFDETWVNLTSEDMLSSGSGYIMMCYHTEYANNSKPIEFLVTPYNESLNKQKLFSSDDRVIALNEYQSELEQNRSWNLIGNPYPCYFDTRYMDTEAPFLVWDSYNKAYAAFSPVDDNYILNPAEAFFIQRPVQDNETLTFLKGGRQTYRNPNDLTVIEARQLGNTPQREVINLVLTQGEKSDRTRVVFNEQAATAYEIGRDAAKMMAMDANTPQLWTVNGNTQFAINERPQGSGIVPLAVRVSGEATISLNSQQDNLLLEDRLNGTTTCLSEQSYTFTTEGLTEGRFYLHYGETTGIREMAAPAVSVENYYNLQGQRVEKGQPGIVIRNGKKIINK